jgi:hypothetical protein
MNFLVSANLGLVILLGVSYYIIYKYIMVYLDVIGERNKLMEIMGITSMEQAENYDPALSWDNDEDEDDLYDIDEIIESNSKASEGDKGAITFNVNYNGFSYSLDVPVYLAEKSADGKKMRFDLDMVNIQKDIEPYDDDSFISKLKTRFTAMV